MPVQVDALEQAMQDALHLQAHGWLAESHVNVGLGWVLNQIMFKFIRVQRGAEFDKLILDEGCSSPSAFNHFPPNMTAACSHSALLSIEAQPTRLEQDGYGVPRSATWYAPSKIFPALHGA